MAEKKGIVYVLLSIYLMYVLQIIHWRKKFARDENVVRKLSLNRVPLFPVSRHFQGKTEKKRAQTIKGGLQPGDNKENPST